MRRSMPAVWLFLAVVGLGVGSIGGWLHAQGLGELDQPAGVKRLGGSDRATTVVSTDKPIYRAGETVYARLMQFRTWDRHPQRQVRARVKVLGPRGQTLHQGSVFDHRHSAGFSWKVPQGAAGGEYTLRVEPMSGDAPAERPFDVRAYRAPRLNTQIEFLRDGYGPGDEVRATVDVTRAEGGVPAGATVTAIARLDGEEVHRGQTTVNADGTALARFTLPPQIRRGEGTLSFVIADGGVRETASKTMPILLQTLDLELYPESGDLVARLPTRVYVEARTPYGKPADFTGEIRTDSGSLVTTVNTTHEGRGRFELDPAPSQRYRLHITDPTGIEATFPLPPVRDRGGVLRPTADRFDPDQPVALTARVRGHDTAYIELRHHARVLGKLRFRDVQPGEPLRASFNPPDEATGVLTATLFAGDDTPLAERLIFRQPTERLDVDIQTDRDRYTPGSPVELTVTTRDQDGNLVGAVVGLTVTDRSVLEMIETREQAPRLPAMVLLEPQVRELADAHVYLDPTNPQAARAVDLLLGTQGWRRFALMRVEPFLQEHGDAARRTLALRNPRQARAPRLADAVAMFQAGAAQPEAAEHAEAQVQAAVEPDAAAENAQANANQAMAPRNERDVDAAAEAEAEPMAEPPEAAARAADVAFAPPMRRRHVRVYAHDNPGSSADTPAARDDFTETVYWHAGIETDPSTGQATVTFDLSDSVTTFEAHADAFTTEGVMGIADGEVVAVEPFYAELKLPLEVTQGDVIQAPVTLVNQTEEPLSVDLTAQAAGPGVEILPAADGGPLSLRVPAQQRIRRLVPVRVTGELTGPQEITIAANTRSTRRDRLTRKLHVAPRGFPIEHTAGGVLEPGNRVSLDIVIPTTTVPGSLHASARVYPTPAANLTQAMERLIREPYGCFEQTSSTSYPLVMAQQYFLTHADVDPKLIAAASDKLETSYRRLNSFETPQDGYEWFGKAPGHEALTAYGLAQFHDMSEVRHVDPQMVRRTRDWLLDQRDGSGGFTRERRALHTWKPDPALSNAYITWCLLESGESPASLSAEINGVLNTAFDHESTYVAALAALVAQRADRPADAAALCQRLAKAQQDDGVVDGAETTIVGSRGQSLHIETTALATLAWLNHPDGQHAASVERAVKWIANQCQSGRFGSTQATVLALKAIVAYDQARSQPVAPGTLLLRVDGEIAAELPFSSEATGALELPDFSRWLRPGQHRVELAMADGSPMPCSLTVAYHADTPASHDAAPVRLDVSLSDQTLTEGEPTEAVAILSNVTERSVPNPVAIVGLPAGLEVRHDQLKELVKSDTIAAYEVRGREIILYWRVLRPNQRVRVPLSLTAAVPGHYTGPASRGYAYYHDEHKHWLPGLSVEITPR